MLQGPEGEFDAELEPDEREALEDERAEKRERERLLQDKQLNYALIRGLRPISGTQSVGAIAFIHLFGIRDLSSKITQFRQW